jgi:hypothetical protein
MGNPSLSPASESREQPPIPSDFPAIGDREPRKQLYVLSEGRSSPRIGNTSFTRADSAIAFPRSLGLTLKADDPPKLHAFAWNTGTRTEKLEGPRSNLLEYITLLDIKTFSDPYFTSINPIFNIINPEKFNHRVARCWATQNIDAGFEVVLLGAMALGSLFSTHIFIHEAEIVEQARLTLDRTFAHSEVLLSVDFVVGWILRAIYLRSATKPHVSWVASCMALHVAESIGLHQELSEIKLTQKAQSQKCLTSEAEIESRRRTYWVACSLNRLFSAQYGRTMITHQNVACRYPTANSDDAANDFISLIQSLPYLCDPRSAGPSADLTDAIMQLGKTAIYKLPLLLIRADSMFCIYRKLRYIGVTLSPTQTEVILSVIRSALEAADSLALQYQQWWNIVGVPFHSVCVLIALNTMESLTLLHKAMETLQNVATRFSSHISREALRTAHYLVKVAEKRRRGELVRLQRCLNLNAEMVASAPTQNPASEGTSDLPLFQWPTDFDLGFPDFLDTDYLWANEDTGMAGVQFE